MEQSPLSRTIKEFEEDLGELLFVRTSRITRLTRPRKELTSCPSYGFKPISLCTIYLTFAICNIFGGPLHLALFVTLSIIRRRTASTRSIA